MTVSAVVGPPGCAAGVRVSRSSRGRVASMTAGSSRGTPRRAAQPEAQDACARRDRRAGRPDEVAEAVGDQPPAGEAPDRLQDVRVRADDGPAPALSAAWANARWRAFSLVARSTPQ